MEKHKEYATSKVNFYLNDILKNNDAIYLFTGIKNDNLKDTSKINIGTLIKENIINEIVLGQKPIWQKYLERYKNILKKYKVIELFLSDKSNQENIIKNIKSKLENEINYSDYTHDIDKLCELIKDFMSDKKVSDKIKMKKLEKSDYFNSVYSEYKETKVLLENIFNYSTFCKNENWNRSMLLYQMDIRVCPYCNRQYITKYQTENIRKTTADLDHYYPKSKYPFLALSLYNFIPSCAICNRNFKRADNREMLYPYEEEFDDDDLQYKFVTKFDKDNNFTYLLGESSDFKLDLVNYNGINKDKVTRAKNNIDLFKLKDVYEIHKEQVKEIIRDFYYYNEIWEEEIQKLFMTSDCENRLFNEETIREMCLGKHLNLQKSNNEILSKLKKDIVDELLEEKKDVKICQKV